MRCPKCQYISFDSGERCRNCGYEFSLSVEDPPVDVKIGRDEPPPGRGREPSFSALDAQLSNPAGDNGGLGSGGGRRQWTAADLPLFSERVADDQAPLVSPTAVPRAPLSVRRQPPVRHKSSAPAAGELALELGDHEAARAGEFAPAAVDSGPAVAGVIRRITAGVLDAAVLGTIHATVFYLTLRLCELPPEQWRVLPLIPLVAFLLLLSGGYFVLFTAAGGQTIGKMITRIRVINAPAAGDMPLRVSFSTAVLRTVACFGSVLALGAGFLPVLFSSDRRAFHDRVAETRVVPA